MEISLKLNFMTFHCDLSFGFVLLSSQSLHRACFGIIKYNESIQLELNDEKRLPIKIISFKLISTNINPEYFGFEPEN